MPRSQMPMVGVRLHPDLMAALRERAEVNHRSLALEVAHRLTQTLQAEATPQRAAA